MNEWKKYGHILVYVLLAALILTLLWNLWPIIMALLGVIGSYSLLAIVLRVFKIPGETPVQLNQEQK